MSKIKGISLVSRQAEHFNLRISSSLRAKLKALAKFYNIKSEAEVIKSLIELSYEKINKQID